MVPSSWTKYEKLQKFYSKIFLFSTKEIKEGEEILTTYDKDLKNVQDFIEKKDKSTKKKKTSKKKKKAK
jgi:hypothetical protein